MRRGAKFRGDRPNHCWSMAICRCFNMAAVCHLGFVLGVFGPAVKSTWWSLTLYYCAKFGWNRCSSIDNMQFVIFCEFGSKMPIHAPLWEFLGYDPLNGSIINGTPKGHILAQKYVHRPVRVTKRPQKKKERNLTVMSSVTWYAACC